MSATKAELNAELQLLQKQINALQDKQRSVQNRLRRMYKRRERERLAEVGAAKKKISSLQVGDKVKLANGFSEIVEIRCTGTGTKMMVLANGRRRYYMRSVDSINVVK